MQTRGGDQFMRRQTDMAIALADVTVLSQLEATDTDDSVTDRCQSSDPTHPAGDEFLIQNHEVRGKSVRSGKEPDQIIRDVSFSEDRRNDLTVRDLSLDKNPDIDSTGGDVSLIEASWGESRIGEDSSDKSTENDNVRSPQRLSDTRMEVLNTDRDDRLVEANVTDLFQCSHQGTNDLTNKTCLGGNGEVLAVIYKMECPNNQQSVQNTDNCQTEEVSSREKSELTFERTAYNSVDKVNRLQGKDVSHRSGRTSQGAEQPAAVDDATCEVSEAYNRLSSGWDTSSAERVDQVIVKDSQIHCADQGAVNSDLDCFNDFMLTVVKTECLTEDPDTPYGGAAFVSDTHCRVEQIKQETDEMIPDLTVHTSTTEAPIIRVTENTVKRKQGHPVKLLFTCEICDHKFSTATKLRSHKKTHTREKHFICDVCQKTFLHLYQLKKHKKVHTVQHNGRSVSKPKTKPRRKPESVHKNVKEVHSCKICERKFQSAAVLEKHVKRFHIEKSFTCDSCHVTFKTSTHLQTHTCSQCVYFECCVCEQVFTDRIQLKKHVANHPDTPEELKYECGVCEMVFHNSRGLKLHTKIHNESMKALTCTECTKTFSQQKSLLNHQKLVHKDKYKCYICSKEFVIQSHLKKHKRTHSRRLKCDDCCSVHKEWVCKKCGEVLKTKDELKAHRLTHQKKYNCVVCDFSSLRCAVLQQHLQTHNDQVKYQCQVCEESFTRASSLYQHHLSHTNLRKYTCEMCGSSFTQRSTLMAHKRIHTGERPFSCSVCEKAFIEKSALRSHMISHSSEKKHHCDVCGKSFPHKCSLVRHSRIHTQDKPFKCPQCVKSFGQSNQLKIHLRSHTGEKPFKCEECGMRFAYMETLKSHMRIHGYGDISCDRCDKTFSNKFHLKRHYRLHTGEVNFVCDICGQGFGRKDYLKKHMKIVHDTDFKY